MAEAMTGAQTSALMKLQESEFQMLKQFKEICERHKLTYYLCGGTLLGAVRHQGFIPWDDDVDVAMPRPDYLRFLEYAKEEIQPPFCVQTRENGGVQPFAQMIYKRIKVKTHTRTNEQIWNAWIDIFPLDTMPAARPRFLIRKYHLLYRRMMFSLSCFSDIVSIHKKERPWVEKILIKCAMLVRPERILNADKQYRKFQKALGSFPFYKGKYIVNMLGAFKFKSLMEREIYGANTEIPFCGEMFRVPEQYDTYLRRLYGDYMVPPPENERNHHEIDMISIEAEAGDEAK